MKIVKVDLFQDKTTGKWVKETTHENGHTETVEVTVEQVRKQLLDAHQGKVDPNKEMN